MLFDIIQTYKHTTTHGTDRSANLNLNQSDLVNKSVPSQTVEELEKYLLITRVYSVDLLAYL